MNFFYMCVSKQNVYIHNISKHNIYKKYDKVEPQIESQSDLFCFTAKYG